MSVATELIPSTWPQSESALSVSRRLALVQPGECAPATFPAEAERLASVTLLHPPAQPVAPAWRLTRRGVMVLTALVACLGGLLVWLAGLSVHASSTSVGNAPAAVSEVTVQPGDTLWSIAGRVAPDRDPRAEVSALQARNGLRGAELTPGQQLAVP